MAERTSKTKEVDSTKKKSTTKKTSSTSKKSPAKKKTTTKKSSSTKKNTTSKKTTTAKKKATTTKKTTTKSINQKQPAKKVPVHKMVDPKTAEHRFEFTQKLPDMEYVEENPIEISIEKKDPSRADILEKPLEKVKISYLSLGLEFVLLLVIFGSICSSIYFINGKNAREKEYASCVQKRESLSKELDRVQSEEKEVLSDIESYSHLDDTIENTKKEYFSSIKQLEDDILAGKTNRKIAYLTFDDGPYYNTYRVFDILDQYGVKATFFTTNINGEYCYDNEGANCWIRYQEYVNRGHTIANHTYTHAIFRGLYSSTDSFMDAVIKQEELIKEKAGGYTTNILRFPGGSSTARGLKDEIIQRLRERGYGWVDWNANDGDGGNLPSREVAWANFTSTINENMEVILYHDYNGITTSLLPEMIEYLQNNGYEIYPLFYESHMVNK